MALVTTPAATGTPSTDGLAYDFLALIQELQALFPTAAGTALASKLAVLGASKNLDTLDIATLKIGGTALTATAAEVNALHSQGVTSADLAKLHAITAAAADINGLPPGGVLGVAAGYKLARGIHTQVAAVDTVATGLTTVVAALVSFQSAPTVKQLHATADIGTQAGAPVAGSILIATFKPTAVNDVTPIAASDFSENLKFAWIAIGT